MKLPSIRLNHKALSNINDALRKEWLVTNGSGAYASSTILSMNTRKYHGMLVAAFPPSGERRVCLAKLDEEISIGKTNHQLGTNEFQNGISPKGYLFLKEFSLSPFPKYVYEVQNIGVLKTIFMPHRQNATITIYNLVNKNDFDVTMKVFPLVNWRYYHTVTDKQKDLSRPIQKLMKNRAGLHFTVPTLTLMMQTTSGLYISERKWVKNIYLREEAERGESCIDDCYQPGYFEIVVKANAKEKCAITTAAYRHERNSQELLETAPIALQDIETLFAKEMRRRSRLLTRFYSAHDRISMKEWLNWIILAADMFTVNGSNSKEKYVIAGYHWFEAWGRDTFISMPGLMLLTGRFEDARNTFLTFKRHCQNGLIPNILSDGAEHSKYNAVDATLWYVNALMQYVKYTCDFKFVQDRLWSGLETTIESHRKGADFNIHMDNDGLLSHNSQLTWMDATINGQPVTPRAGKAVEVQALWYNALRIMEVFAKRFEENGKAEEYAKMAERARKSFVEKFWNLNGNCLYDNIGEQCKDNALRPNQIIAVAFDFTMLDHCKSRKVVEAVRRELLTPYGLRTLRRTDEKYIGTYYGNRRSRNKAYHQGTVWPWLLSSLTTAFLKVNGYTHKNCEYAFRHFLMPLFTEQVHNAGLGAISEVFDGDPPHTPRGCIAQAWSVAEPFRAYVEDVLCLRPKYEKTILCSLGHKDRS